MFAWNNIFYMCQGLYTYIYIYIYIYHTYIDTNDFHIYGCFLYLQLLHGQMFQILNPLDIIVGERWTHLNFTKISCRLVVFRRPDLGPTPDLERIFQENRFGHKCIQQQSQLLHAVVHRCLQRLPLCRACAVTSHSVAALLLMRGDVPQLCLLCVHRHSNRFFTKLTNNWFTTQIFKIKTQQMHNKCPHKYKMYHEITKNMHQNGFESGIWNSKCPGN